jgi:rhodanese-related sulfurtransferase
MNTGNPEERSPAEKPVQMRVEASTAEKGLTRNRIPGLSEVLTVYFSKEKGKIALSIVLMTFCLTAVLFGQATSLPSSHLINPDELVKVLQATKGEKPLMLQVGSYVLYAQAHIPGSEYVGPVTSELGLQQLRRRVESLPRTKFIVLYCGCCPWSHCPNVKPADDALHAMGFTNVKVLYIANNFGADWVEKGYPVARGQ